MNNDNNDGNLKEEKNETPTEVPPNSSTPPIPQPVPLPYPIIKKSRDYSKTEYWLLLFSVVLGVLFDRLFLANYSNMFTQNIFWLLFTVAYYIYSWEKVKNNVVLWIICGLNSLLCIWGFIFDYRSNYGTLTFLVIPAVLMAHVQYSKYDLTLLECGKIVLYWFKGWFVEPFSGIFHFFGAGKAVLKDKSSSKGTFKKILLGLVISLPLILFIIVPLLSGADLVFAYFMRNIIKDFALRELINHLLIVFVAAVFIFSFFWNYRFEYEDKQKPTEEKQRKLFDSITLGVVLIVVLLVYALFIGVQFTYLFAQKGLPNNISYSDYAREGFAQIIVISAINISIFAISIYKTKKSKFMTILLALLLICSGIMLVSGLSRLNLYINIHHLTWLRLLSLWFIIYLFAMLIVCTIRLFKDQFPSLGIGAITLLAWFVILGYCNPDALIVQYNISQYENPIYWIDTNQKYITNVLSDDARLVLHKKGYMPTEPEPTTSTPNYYYKTYSHAKEGRSYSSRKLYKLVRSMKEYEEVIEWDSQSST